MWGLRVGEDPGIVPERFCALRPIPKGKSAALMENRGLFGLGT